MGGLSIAARYACFAGVATLLNLGVQAVSHRIYTASLYPGILLGTLAGLLVKYVLDKRYIFHYRVRTRGEDLVKFVLYGLMGVVTTAMFWGTELLFDALFRSAVGRYTGAVLGLCAGYALKYALDRRFVFTAAPGGGDAA